MTGIINNASSYAGYYGTGKKVYGAAAQARKALLDVIRKKQGATPGGKTLQKYRDKYSAAWQAAPENGIKYKHVSISYKPSKRGKLTKALSQPGQVYNYATGGQTSGLGVQAAVQMMVTPSSDVVALHTALNDAVATTTVRASEQFLFTGTKEEIEFTNCSPTTCELEIYVLIDKTTSNAPPDPVSVWSNGILQTSNDALIPVESAATLWLKPTMQKAFNITYWSKRYPISLTPGEKCKFTLNFKRNRLLDTSYLANYSGVRGITHRLMLVQRGTLVDADNAKTFTAGNQSISETKVIWAWKRTMYGQILSTLPTVNKQLGLNFPTVLAAQWHIDEDTGEPENAATTTEFA